MPADYLARVRKICLSLPETTEKIAWGAPTFRVRGKLFAMFLNNHHKDGRIALWLPAEPGVQKDLTSREPKMFFVPPYVGVRGWIGVHLDRNDAARVKQLVCEAYHVVAPAKLAEAVLEKYLAKPRQRTTAAR